MKILAVLMVACLAFWFIGLRVADRGSDVNAVAQASKDNINSVAGVLRQATANAQRAGSSETWQGKINARCSRDSVTLSRLGSPRNLDEVAVYLGKALRIVRRQHERVVAGLPADEASAATRARRAFAKQEALLARARRAAARGDTTALLAAVEDLRALARVTNGNLISLGLTECTLPSWGIPL